MNTHVAVANTHIIVSDVHHNVLNTHAVVSDIHRNVIKIQEGSDSQRQVVGDTRTLQRHRINAYHFPDSK